jgi:PAS domain S-box-containing protein
MKKAAQLSESPFPHDALNASSRRVGVLRDITEDKQAENELIQSKERFRQVAETVSDFIWEVDANGLYTYTSPSVEKILGYRDDELIGEKYFYDLFAPEVREELKAAAFQAFKAKQPFKAFPNPNVSKAGKIVHLETSGIPMLDEAGNLIGYRGADTDITARKHAEENLKNSISLMMAAFESTADGILIVDSSGKIIHFNEQFTRLWKIPLEILEGKDDEKVVQFVLDQLKAPDQFEAKVKELYAHPDAVSFDAIEFKDGRVFERYSQPQRIDGKAVGRVWSFRDVTKRIQAEEELKRSCAEIARLKDRLEAENIYLRKKVSLSGETSAIIGTSDPIKYVHYRIDQVASLDSTVLIVGETGTGKGLVARAVYEGSLRRDQPMIHVNCAVLPANLIESELFGREKGAFTGAQAKQIGRFELAHKGTIFLDEIAELPVELQAKLLRVVENGEFERLGSEVLRHADVRMISATHHRIDQQGGPARVPSRGLEQLRMDRQAIGRRERGRLRRHESRGREARAQALRADHPELSAGDRHHRRQRRPQRG